MDAAATLRTLPLCIAATAAMLCACSDDDHSYVHNVGDGETTPTMSTTDVNTFISDSGYTRYFITAPIWNMHDEAADPFWRFPDGLEMEQYDRALRVVATIRCDSALYLSQKRIWRLDGNVVMVNTERDSFLTQQVFWNQNKREVYSDSFIHIVRSDRVIEGYGFTSNEQMTAYTVNRPTGIFPANRREAATTPADTLPDSLSAPAMRRRQPSQRQQSAPASGTTPIAPSIPKPLSSQSPQITPNTLSRMPNAKN